MKQASLTGLHRVASIRRTKAKNMYAERPIKYWAQEQRRWEIVLDAITEYKTSIK